MFVVLCACLLLFIFVCLYLFLFVIVLVSIRHKGSYWFTPKEEGGRGREGSNKSCPK